MNPTIPNKPLKMKAAGDALFDRALVTHIPAAATGLV